MQKFRHHRRRIASPVPIGKLVDGHSRRWKIQALHRLEVIRRKWGEVAGEFMAARVVPVRLVRKTLRLAASDPSWASEMTYLAAELLERLQQLLPKGWVEEVRVVASEPMPPEPPRDDAILNLPSPTPEMLRKANELTGITLDSNVDPSLVEAIQRATIASLRRKSATTKEE